MSGARSPRPASGRAPRGSLRGGFTLLELLAVMAILVIVAGVVAPAVGLVGRHGGLAKAARQIGGAVHEARTHAGRTRTWAELSVSVGSVKKRGPVVLRLTGRDADGASVDLGRVELPGAVTLEGVLVEGEKITDEAVLRFHPRGLTLPAAVRLDSDEDELTVCVKPINGVSVIEGLASLEQCKRDE